MMTYKHFGWPVSPYSAKTRAYLGYKQIPHIDVEPGILTLQFKIKRAVGRIIMPTVFTPDGEVWQDSSEIIDNFEARFPDNPVIPTTPTQRLAAYLLELHGDEWLAGVALHYRWSNPTNTRFAIDEFGRSALPWLPGFVRRPIARAVAAKMQSYLSVVGAVGDTRQGFERFTLQLLDQLNTHLAEHPFLLGTRPCIGDFAIFGPLWAHLYRDVGSTPMFDDLPHVRAWFDRLLAPSGEPGAFLANDQVPETLDPIFRTLFAEQFVYIHALLDKIHDYCEQHPDATRVPRALGEHPFCVGGVAGTRKLITFTQWMAQRPLDAYHNASDTDQQTIKEWLQRIDGTALCETQVRHRMIRQNYKEVLERQDAKAGAGKSAA